VVFETTFNRKTSCVDKCEYTIPHDSESSFDSAIASLRVMHDGLCDFFPV